MSSACKVIVVFFSSRRRHTRYWRDWSSDVCSSDLGDDHAREHDDEERQGRPEADDVVPVEVARAAALRAAEPGDGAHGVARSEERRVGKERRSRWSPYHQKKNRTHHLPTLCPTLII